MTIRKRVRFKPTGFGRGLFFLAALLVAFPVSLSAVDAGSQPLFPGETLPQPRQRGLDEIQAIPVRNGPCPVCGFMVEIPLVDLLMRNPAGNGAAPAWRMHAERRDADLCPYPGAEKVGFQADIVICPSCGYANESDRWEAPVPAGAKEWVIASLRPVIREAQIRLLGARGMEMDDREIISFFNRQEDIPDTVRTEHYRTYLQAVHAPALDRARASWLAAWAARREAAGPPRAAVFEKRAAAHWQQAMEREKEGAGLRAGIDFLQARQRKARQGKSGLPDAEDMALRIILAGMWDRLGFLDEAEKILLELYQECRERFLRTDQDPLWSATNARASRTHRLNELETLRSDAEADVLVRMDLVRRERELLNAAAQCLRDALRAGELDSQPDKALFYSYMIAEFLRRAGNLPLAAEWYKELLRLAAQDSPIAHAAAKQLDYVGEEAGERVNLLSALGQDGDLFEKLRSIHGGGAR